MSFVGIGDGVHRAMCYHAPSHNKSHQSILFLPASVQSEIVSLSIGDPHQMQQISSDPIFIDPISIFKNGQESFVIFCNHEESKNIFDLTKGEHKEK